jgi:hypothetical protein
MDVTGLGSFGSSFDGRLSETNVLSLLRMSFFMRSFRFRQSQIMGRYTEAESYQGVRAKRAQESCARNLVHLRFK